MLNGDVKLVGCTISCGYQVHIQSHFFALDREGLKITWDAGVFKATGKTIMEVIMHSEFGLTNSIMEKGFTIDCPLIQYALFDWKALWRKPSKGLDTCNGGINPTQEKKYGTIGNQYSLSPFETVFYKRGGTVHNECLKAFGQSAFNETTRCDSDVVVDDASEWILEYLRK